MDAAQPSGFGQVHERLTQIVDEVSAEDISLDDALKLYEEAVKLGLSACDLSEQDIEAHLAAEGDGAEGAEVADGAAASDGDGAEVADVDGAEAAESASEIAADESAAV